MTSPTGSTAATSPTTTTGTSSTATSASGASSSDPGASIAGNFQTFLTLLTTQLKTQNPLDPLDTNQFTQELVQFASVEQQLKSNQSLDSLVSAMKASAAASAVSYIGTEVTTSGAAADLTTSGAQWTYTAASDATATVTIRDQNGNTVFSQSAPISAGQGAYAWDGRTNAGGQAPPGSYQITIDARDSSGQPVTVSTQVLGLVSGVDLSGGSPQLLIGSRSVPLSSITSVRGRSG